MRKVAAAPKGPGTRDRSDLRPGIRSFHLRLARDDVPSGRVKRPVHILYYRVAEAELIEIVRVLHGRMEPSRHLHQIADGE